MQAASGEGCTSVLFTAAPLAPRTVPGILNVLGRLLLNLTF